MSNGQLDGQVKSAFRDRLNEASCHKRRMLGTYFGTVMDNEIADLLREPIGIPTS